MAKQSNQKTKLLILWRELLRRGDEEKPIPTNQLIETLAREGVSAERKSVYADMEALREFGLDVQFRKGKDAGWFVGQREFELAELKLLVDAVQSSRFISRRKSAALIRKLEGLTSVHQARQLQRQVYVDRRVKTMNESIFYNVDRLQGAIAGNRAVTFRYFEYNAGRERVFRRAGERYRLTPYGLIWDSENYYLAGWDELRGEVRHYRVDKMADIVVSKSKGHPRGEWTAEGYARKHFGMFSGRPCQLRLRCENRLAGVVIDRFGLEVSLVPDGPDHFTASVDLVVSPPLWGWLFGLGPGVEVRSPSWAVEEFAARLEEEKTDIRLVALLDTLEYLKRGGRVSASVALVGGLLAIKPVVAVQDGLVEVIGKARGSKNGHNLLVREIQNGGGIDVSRPLATGFTGLDDRILRKYIQDAGWLWEDLVSEVPVYEVGSTIGTHAGPGAIAVAFFSQE